MLKRITNILDMIEEIIARRAMRRGVIINRAPLQLPRRGMKRRLTGAEKFVRMLSVLAESIPVLAEPIELVIRIVQVALTVYHVTLRDDGGKNGFGGEFYC